MESSDVAKFRQCVLDGAWDSADEVLMRLGFADDEALWVRILRSQMVACTHAVQSAKFLISQQKYLELLEARKTAAALHILREELAPLSTEPDQLHSLSRSVSPSLTALTQPTTLFISLLMCQDSPELRQRAGWDGASGTSRRRLLVNLQSTYIVDTRSALLLTGCARLQDLFPHPS